MDYGIATVTLGGALRGKMEAIAAAGFPGFELMEWDLQGTSAPAARGMAADLGLEILNYQPLRDFEGGPRDQLLPKLERVERIFDGMEQLGTRTLLVCSNVSDVPDLDDNAVADDLALLGERAAARGFSIGYEALSWGLRVNTFRQAWRMIERSGADNIGLVLDSFHTFALNDPFEDLAEVPVDRIALIQVSDAPWMDLDVKSWSRHHRCLPGEGDFDVAAFLAPVLANGYAGPISLEIFNDHYKLRPPAPLARQGMAALRDVTSAAMDLTTRSLIASP
ncbi:sugar phosphate isomerase/epimerase [Streptacidiphilus pinicola]|uniref:Sugar phosphate isomerase/epimerase n=1 Tax=Streptacidiphilus pinicola TaxID=2219663 RepID=A0A2X0JFF8_9ACTN|nr:sugar phosphate isomerase/epimerase family protein [Streptacidiphilus pinicola]RAG86338.1 sugar phosphate isomerase/epimerase [Streptacidiphilus pinicola]